MVSGIFLTKTVSVMQITKKKKKKKKFLHIFFSEQTRRRRVAVHERPVVPKVVAKKSVDDEMVSREVLARRNVVFLENKIPSRGYSKYSQKHLGVFVTQENVELKLFS